MRKIYEQNLVAFSCLGVLGVLGVFRLVYVVYVSQTTFTYCSFIFSFILHFSQLVPQISCSLRTSSYSSHSCGRSLQRHDSTQVTKELPEDLGAVPSSRLIQKHRNNPNSKFLPNRTKSTLFFASVKNNHIFPQFDQYKAVSATPGQRAEINNR